MKQEQGAIRKEHKDEKIAYKIEQTTKKCKIERKDEEINRSIQKVHSGVTEKDRRNRRKENNN